MSDLFSPLHTSLSDESANVVLDVWMRDVLGASDHLESFGESARIERRIVA